MNLLRSATNKPKLGLFNHFYHGRKTSKSNITLIPESAVQLVESHDLGYGVQSGFDDKVPFPAFTSTDMLRQDTHCLLHCKHYTCHDFRHGLRKHGKKSIFCTCDAATLSAEPKRPRPEDNSHLPALEARFATDSDEIARISRSVDWRTSDITFHLTDAENIVKTLNRIARRQKRPHWSRHVFRLLCHYFTQMLERSEDQMRTDRPAQLMLEIELWLKLGMAEFAYQQRITKEAEEELLYEWSWEARKVVCVLVWVNWLADQEDGEEK
ncbi:hypothetical protein EJ04DRAFT_517183, partial [Polyplosphaeria fusca]